MKPPLHAQPISWTIVLSIALLSTGCSTVELASQRRDSPITIDGDIADWSGIPTYIDKSNVALSVCNDNENLYLCIYSSNRDFQMQAMVLGLTVQLQPKGTAGKSLSIAYPLGGMGPGMMSMGSRDILPESESFKDQPFATAPAEMELVGPEKNDRYRTSVSGNSGVHAKISNNGNAFVYELQIPLKASQENRYALDAATGSSFEVDIQTTTIEESMLKAGGGRGGPPEGDMPGRGGVPPGGGMPSDGGGQGMGKPGGPGGGPPRNMPSQVKFEVKVTLAEIPVSKAAAVKMW